MTTPTLAEAREAALQLAGTYANVVTRFLESLDAASPQPASASTPQPSWRQLAAIPESHVKSAVLHALGITPPPEGVSRYLELGDGLLMEHGAAGLICTDPTLGSYYSGAQEAIRRYRLSKGTPSGDITRRWMAARGLLPSTTTKS
jgi:hypothetical protein